MPMSRTTLAATAVLTLSAAASIFLLQPLGIDKVRTSTAGSGSTVVPIELVLLVDTSGSVDASEYALQKDGYADAFRSAELTQLIERQGGIVVTYIEWSDADHQDVRIDWTHLRTRSDCYSFAARIGTITRSVEGATRMAPALQFAADRIATNDYIGLKRVIDVSGDGRGQNHDYYLEHTEYAPEYGTPWDDVIADISGKIDVVNGICITTDEGVVDFYRDILPQGEGSFMMQVNTFDQFDDGIITKLMREIGNLPGLYD